MNRLFVIAGLVILVVALVFLNQGIKRSGLPDSDEAPPAPAAAAPAPAAPPSGAPGALPAEQTVGNPVTAKHHVLIGWSYTDANQQRPEALNTPLQAIQGYIQQAKGTISAEIVNVDVPAADRSPAARAVTGNGIFVDGKPVFTGDISAASPQQVMGSIAAATR